MLSFWEKYSGDKDEINLPSEFKGYDPFCESFSIWSGSQILDYGLKNNPSHRSRISFEKVIWIADQKMSKIWSADLSYIMFNFQWSLTKMNVNLLQNPKSSNDIEFEKIDFSHTWLLNFSVLLQSFLKGHWSKFNLKIKLYLFGSATCVSS